MRGPILPAKSAEVYSSSRFLVKALMDNLMDYYFVFFCFFDIAVLHKEIICLLMASGDEMLVGHADK